MINIENNLPKKYKEYFDLITCFEVSEYLFNPNIALKNIYQLLKPQGILLISFCFLYPVHEPFKNDYLRYTVQGIAKLLGENGFKILEMINREMKPESFEYYKQFMKSEGFHASKQTRHDILGWIIKAEKI